MFTSDFETKNMQNQVIVIGAGLAGMVAAHVAQAEGASVVLIDRSAIGLGSNSAMSNGRFSCPTASYSVGQYIQDTMKVGKMINHKPTVERIAGLTLHALDYVSAVGFDFEGRKDHCFFSTQRTDVFRGVPMVGKLAEQLKNAKGISFYGGFYVTELLQRNNRLIGVRGLDKKGRGIILMSPSVVLATGGAGAIYLRNDNQKSTMGRGYYLAAAAGLPLWDMEFVQFYPLVLNEPKLPAMMVYPPYPKEVRLITASGVDLLKKYCMGDINDAMRENRDTLSQILYEEDRKASVYVDFRAVPAEAWQLSPLNLLSRIKFDFRTQPVRISPGAHFFMGGLQTNDQGQTAINGLYACGEVTWGFHGANRLGGNALTECLVSGMVAGRNAAAHSLAQQSDADLADLPLSLEGKLAPTAFAFRRFRQQLRTISWKSAGIVRDESGLKAGLDEAGKLERQLRASAPETVIDRKRKADLLGAVFVLRAILTASLDRKESRGAFVRKEYPSGDNVQWRKNSCLKYNPQTDEFSVSYHVAG